ncbi:MAG: clan AA aspartic protease [Treponema sp.]|jgi:clan AA aspartic protease|nr:clan AA aspartic protease [Treponema sp.]
MECKKMGLVRTSITLKNVADAIKAEAGLIQEPEIRQTTIDALVDTGAWTLVINEAVRKQLGVGITRTDTGTLADGTASKYNIVGPLEVRWKNRSAICEALVLPDAEEVLLGAIPLEAMDLMVNPTKQEVAGVHGDQVIHCVKNIYLAPSENAANGSQPDQVH